MIFARLMNNLTHSGTAYSAGSQSSATCFDDVRPKIYQELKAIRTRQDASLAVSHRFVSQVSGYGRLNDTTGCER